MEPAARRQAPSPERLGYTWLEFGRRAADGTLEFRTIGCGLKAVAGRGIARHWFFVTTQRPGAELRLLPDSRVPLTREKLREEIGSHGFVYDRAADYRRAVDEHLFGLGEHRYEALVNLLIQLRQPQLSKKPDEKLLSRALTEALPPLSPGLVTTVAEAFRGLDEERDALRSLAEAQQAAADFLGHYRRYARVAAKRKAAGPRLTQSRYEQLGRDLAAAEEAFTAARQQLAEAQDELLALEEQRAELEARRDALQADPAMRDAERLEQLREDADRREKSAQDREEHRDRLASQVRKYADRATQTAHQAGTGRDKLARALGEAATASADAFCANQHQTAVVALDPADWTSSRRARRTIRPAPTWMPPRHRRPTCSPRPGGLPWPSPTGRNRRSRGLARCSGSPRNASGGSRQRRLTRAGCRLRSRPRPTGSRPRMKQQRNGCGCFLTPTAPT